MLSMSVFTQEGLGNAAIILGGVFGPLYNLYSRKVYTHTLSPRSEGTGHMRLSHALLNCTKNYRRATCIRARCTYIHSPHEVRALFK